jgi:AraC-like DNA-binding protein
MTNIRLRPDLLARYYANPYEVIGAPIPPSAFGLRLLHTYIDVLADPTIKMSAGESEIIAANLYDLVALSIGGVHNARKHTGGIRAARLHAIKADIRRHLGQGGLSINEVARRQGISTSYVRRLFAAEGSSFAHYLLTERLTLAYRMCSDPRLSHRPIGLIAYDAGFNDLSYFNRCFRRRYGMTPSDVRAAR